MQKTFTIKSSNEMVALGQKIGSLAKPNMVITLIGDLGAGKTTLTKGIGLGIGVVDIINSPTFNIMKIYSGAMKLYHLDVYRLDGASDDFDLEEYFESGGLTVVEWALNIEEILPLNRLEISLKILDETTRTASISARGEEYKQLLQEIEL